MAAAHVCVARKLSPYPSTAGKTVRLLFSSYLRLTLNVGTILLHLFAAVLYARHAQLGISPRTSSSTYGLQIGSDSRPNGHASHSTKVSAPINGPSQPPPPLPSPSFTSPSSTQPVPECISNQAGPSTPTHHHAQLPTSFPYPPIKSIYITAPNPFPTLESFVLSSADRYGLDLYRFGGGMKAALSEYLGCGGGRGVRGVLVGTRRGDPNGGMYSSSARGVTAMLMKGSGRCGTLSTDRSFLARFLASPSDTRLVLCGRLDLLEGVGCTVV